jgi:peptidoglycan/xylan/chitin deacetylase (PgdA/CDA1 family)
MDRVTRRILDLVGRVVMPAFATFPRARRSAPILLYHRVSPQPDPAYDPLPPDWFAAHCSYLRQAFDVVPLREVIERAETGRSLAGICAITFDDGYEDFRTHAYPILRTLNFPATMFLVAESVREGVPPWTYRFNRIVQRESVARDFFHRLGTMRASSRGDWIGSAERRLGISGELPRMLRAPDVASLRADGLVEWGCHSRTHAFLTGNSEEEIEREVYASRAELQQLVGQELNFFAYPNGLVSPLVQERVRRAGYKAAFAVGQSAVSRRSSLYALPRFDVGTLPIGMFALELTGVIERARRFRIRPT